MNTATRTPESSAADAAAHPGAYIGAFVGSALLALQAAFSGGPSPRKQMLREAAGVRSLANRHRDSDRGFAADLDAAADRHLGSAA